MCGDKQGLLHTGWAEPGVASRHLEQVTAAQEVPVESQRVPAQNFLGWLVLLLVCRYGGMSSAIDAPKQGGSPGS